MSQNQAREFANNNTLCGGGLHKRHVYCIEQNDTGKLGKERRLSLRVRKELTQEGCIDTLHTDGLSKGRGSLVLCLNTMPESLLTTTHYVLEDYVSCRKGKEVKLMGGGTGTGGCLTHGTQVVEVNVKYLPSCLHTRPESLPSTTHNMVHSVFYPITTSQETPFC